MVSGVSDINGLTPLDSRPESLSQLVYATIRKAIVSKVLMPGTVVSEAALAQRLVVSKTPVREALLRLQSAGLVEQDGSRGLRVVLPSVALIRQGYEVRWALEGVLARLAAQRATQEQQASIAAAAGESLDSAEGADIAGFQRWDHAFHHAVAVAAANARLAELAEDARMLAGVLRERDAPGVQAAIRCARQHIEISEAIGRHDAEAAGAAAERHVADVQQMVLEAFTARVGAAVS
jgi:DNA-binding GntR family transcriptional regulator